MEMSSARVPKLYVIADRASIQDREEWLERIRNIATLLENYPQSALQIRSKDPSGQTRIKDLEQAREVTAPFIERGLPVLGNTSHQHALQLGYSGVHLSEASHRLLPALPLEKNNDFLIGASTHTAEALEHASSIGVDFAVLSPLYAPFSKPGEGMGLQKFKELQTTTSLPILALGGIEPDRTANALNAGANGVAVVTAIMNATHPATSIKEFWFELNKTHLQRIHQQGERHAI
jgi:thiamine-phosphate diphosphorylase